MVSSKGNVVELKDKTNMLSSQTGGAIQTKMQQSDIEGGISAQDLMSNEDVILKIMSFCSWPAKMRLTALNRQFQDSFCRNDKFWNCMCDQLAEESYLYVPEIPCVASWRDLFVHLYTSKDRFVKAPADVTSPSTVDGEVSDVTETDTPDTKKEKLKFQVQVCVRMRPRPRGSLTAAEKDTSPNSGAMTVLPLHQRLALIRKQHLCSPEEARRLLWQRGGGKADPWDCAEVKAPAEPGAAKSSEENSGEGEVGDSSAAHRRAMCAEQVQACVVSVAGGKAGNVLMCCPGSGLRDFTFDAVFNEASAQPLVYDSAPRLLVADFINGRNSCIFAYGQTGSGKTYTMFGPDGEAGTALTGGHEGAGIVPRACSEVMGALRARRKRGVKVTLTATYVEVFGDVVSDLLNEGKAVGMWQGVAHRAVYSGDCAVLVEGEEDLRGLLLKGDACKRRAATAMNERSSRAHSLLLLRCLQENGETEVVSSLCLADLGGSEQVLKSGVAGLEEEERGGGFKVKGERMIEAININIGLLALKSCITALVEQRSHVPFNDSRLTMLLAEALGGDCRTCVVVTGSSEPKHALETLNALRFGEDCSQIATTASDNLGAALRAIRALDTEITLLEEEIKSKERWEVVRTLRSDEQHVRIDYREFVEFVAAEHPPQFAAVQPALLAAFLPFDKEETGWVSAGDFPQVLSALKEAGTITEEDAAVLHKEAELGNNADEQNEEVVVKTILVGAEEERERLELLLSRRRILTGA